jgi:mannose-1-phosphate guanylyltransferase / mannose-6-phosphate isomerase
MDTLPVGGVVVEAPSRLAGLAAGQPRPGVTGAGGMSVVPVILCGGSGTRLWPLSREGLPKQFWPLLSSHSMLQETALRAIGVLPDGTRFGRPVIVCNKEHRFLIAAQLSDVGVSDPCIVLEPIGRNSAPAVAAAALVAAEQDPEAVLWIMPSDALIDDSDALHQALATAVQAARMGRIATFGIRATGPETGFGYIEVGNAVDAAFGAFEVVRFVEKPDAQTAAALVASDRYLWNSGMFVVTAATLLTEFELHAPDVLAHMTEAMANALRDTDFIRPSEAAFTSCPAISLDYALAERTKCMAVVPTDFVWSDVGNWAAVWKVSPKDARGNVVIGDALLEAADRCLVRSEGILTAVVGLQDAVIVVTDDAILALHRDYAQHVKQIVDRLKGAGRAEAVAHRRVHRPWGYYESMALEDRFQVKRIVVDPGQKLSLQKHFHRAEHWVVVRGSALVTRNDEEILVCENESIYLPLGCIHRLENVGRIQLTLIEVQVGAYLGEDDIVRISDEYGR